MPEKDSRREGSRRGGRTSEQDDRDRSGRSHSARGGSRSGMSRGSSARNMRDGDRDRDRGSDRARRSGDAVSSSTTSQPLERQTSNNEDSMAMLLGLAGKKKPRKRSDSDSSSSSSSDSSKGSSKGGPPLTGEKSKQKVKDGPLLRAAAQGSSGGGSDRGLDLSNRSNDKRGSGDDDTSSGAAMAAPKKFMQDNEGDDVMTMSYPTKDVKRSSSGGSSTKNDWVTRPDPRKVDQSVNLMDIEAARGGGKMGSGSGGRPGMKDAYEGSSTSFTSHSSGGGGSAYSRNSFSRNKKNPYLKVSPWENFLFACKDFFRNLGAIVCNAKCLGVFAVILLIAILLPILLPKGGVVKESSLLVPINRGSSTADGPSVGNLMGGTIIDTIEHEGITYLAPVWSREEAEERFEIIQKILMEHHMMPYQDSPFPDRKDDVYALEGLRWIAEYDPAQLSLEADEGAILQRYALAVFFFATHPGTSANRTTDEALRSNVGASGNDGTAAGASQEEEEVDDASKLHERERRIDSYGANWMISDNFCDWQGIECQDNSKVVHLNMSGTTLQGTLPVELALLKELSVMDLSHNYLEGELPLLYMQRLTKLKFLMLHDNLLHGLLPPNMGEWTSLEYVNLAQNKFSGRLPPNLDELTNLELLFLQENLLSGSIPSMKGMKALEYLYLNNNDFTGMLPHDLFKDKALVDVRLEYNSFTGPLPDQVHKLHELEVLSVGNNDLNGTIPDVFQHTKNLIALDLHKNEFSGTLPASLGQLTNLEHLLLDHNELTGTIAEEWFQMNKLRTLVLHHNKLEGDIPSTINGLVNLHDLWLNHNEFNGSIPNQLGECSNLVNLYLHDNKLTGTIPSNFHELAHLGSLRVQHNKLTGKVSQDLCGLKQNFSLSYMAADCEAETFECTCCDKCY